MRPFLLDDQGKAKLKKLKEFAESHRIEVDDMLDIYNGREKPVGDRKGYSCNIPVGYRVVFCVEFQKKGWARHMSVSVYPRKPNHSAHPLVIEELMDELGFQGKMIGEDVAVYFEDQKTVVNVIEYMKEEKV